MDLPAARLVDDRPLAEARRAVRTAARRTRSSPGALVVLHSLAAGVLQAGALTADIARGGGAPPGLAAMAWAAAGLALVALVPALLTTLGFVLAPPTRRGGRVALALAIGAGFYLALPALALGGRLEAIAALVPTAVAWHAVLARLPVRPLEARGRRW